MNEGLYDISNWCKKPKLFFEKFLDKTENRDKVYIEDLRDFNIDHIKTYCLLKAKAYDKPMGVYTMLIKGLPIDNLFWWDFILESKLGFIQIFRTQSKIELMTNIKDFDIKKFFNFNFKKYSEEIEKAKSVLEEHTLYINHFDSYCHCVNELWKEIEKLNIDPSVVEEKLKDKDCNYSEIINNFMSDNIKYHSFGKSLLLNSAFLIESYINMIIRLSAKDDLKKYPDILKKHLKSNFSEKLKNLNYYSTIFNRDIDVNNQKVKDVLQVMSYRNKYVHSDLSSKLNEIGTVYFDDFFPVFPKYDHSPIVENIVRTYQLPSLNIVKFSYEASKEFIDFVEDHFIDSEKSKYVQTILNQNPIGFNHSTKNFSSIFSNRLQDFKIQ